MNSSSNIGCLGPKCELVVLRPEMCPVLVSSVAHLRYSSQVRSDALVGDRVVDPQLLVGSSNLAILVRECLTVHAAVEHACMLLYAVESAGRQDGVCIDAFVVIVVLLFRDHV